MATTCTMLGVPVAGSHSEMMPAHSEAALRLIKPRATKTNAATACKFNVTPTPTVAYAATQGSGWLEGDFTRVAFSGASAELQLRPNIVYISVRRTARVCANCTEGPACGRRR